MFSPIGLTVVAAIFFAGMVVGALFWRRGKVFLRFLAGLTFAWLLLLIVYQITQPAEKYLDWLQTSEAATVTLAAAGGLLYLWSLFTFRPMPLQKWHQSGPLLAAIALLVASFLRSAYQPEIVCQVQWPAAILFIATVWRFGSEPLVHLGVMAVLVASLFTANRLIAPTDERQIAEVALAVAGVSVCLAVVGTAISPLGRREGNPRWYHQALLFMPLFAVTMSAAVAGGLLLGQGISMPIALTVASLAVVLLLVSVAFCQVDLFGFFGISFAVTALAFYSLAGAEGRGYIDRYATVCLAVGYGLGIASLVLKPLLRNSPRRKGFAGALYLSAVATAFTAMFLIPLRPVPAYVAADALLVAGLVLLGHIHSRRPFINYIAGILITGAAYLLLGPWHTPPSNQWAHILMLLTAGFAIAHLVFSLGLREFLRRLCGTSDRMARRQSTPLTVIGMTLTLGLLVWLVINEVRVYWDLFGYKDSPLLAMLGPGAGFLAWLGVLGAFLASMWLFRLTFRTFLFYVAGICATCYLGLFWWPVDPYGYLIYAVGGYGAAHLLVYLYEERYMTFLSRFCSLYRDERRASTLIFTLAAISSLVGAGLAAFRPGTHEALIMLGVLSGVFLAWAFVWRRGVMLYPAILVVTLALVSIWHNVPAIRPSGVWDAYRLTMNAAILGFLALFWLGIGNQLHAARGDIFHLASPARNCSVVLALVAMGFACVLAFCPNFNSHLPGARPGMRQLVMSIIALGALVGYWSWARLVFRRRFYIIMAGLCVLVLGIYLGRVIFGIYFGPR